nr:Chain B, pCPE3 [synthetic construct]4N0C_F Chain F, pCPE3 [synthetic construct]
MPAGRPWDL